MRSGPYYTLQGEVKEVEQEINILGLMVLFT